MREIILDTETTGLSPDKGHRITEIGCVELFNHIPTGQFYHSYVNPERDVPPQAAAISGLTTEFLRPFPVFAHVVEDFLAFIGDSPLVIHNASFDLMFLNAELKRLEKPVIPATRALDTLVMARKKFPGSPASLDALCKRFNIDLSKRDKHGALIDSELLAQVYLELLGGRQRVLKIDAMSEAEETVARAERNHQFPVRRFNLSPSEKEAHTEFVKQLKNPLWEKLLSS
jgi:DNA polymerase-3 subunit epsilon